MPYITLPIEEVDESVKRPIVVSVLKDLVRLFGLPEKLPLVFKGVASQNPYLRSTTDYHFFDKNNRYNADVYLVVNESQFEDNEYTRLQDNAYFDSRYDIFQDKPLGVEMGAVYRSKKVTITAAITGSQTQVERWRAAIKQRIVRGLLNGLHGVKYHFPVPMSAMQLLMDIHTCRENVEGYGDTLGEWLKEKFTNRMTVLTDANGNSPIFAIAQMQSPIQGWFDFGTGEPVPSKEDEGSQWVLPFTYTFYCDVPEMMNVRYEYVVHNQLIHHQWIQKPPPMAELDFIKKQGSHSESAMDTFRFQTMTNEYTYSIRPGLPIPIFDDWKGDKPAEGYVSIIRAMVQVGKNPNRVMNYSNMGEWSLHPYCATYMKYTNGRPARWYDNVMVSMLYHEYELMDMQELSLNDNLSLFTEETLKKRNRYHVALTMLNDATLLTNQAMEDLKHNACFFKYWIDTIYPGTAEKYGWDIHSCALNSEDDNMTELEIDTIIKDVSNGVKERSVWPLVGRFAVHANKQQ